MRIPFWQPRRRGVAVALTLILAWLLLVLTGLGVFRLYFDFEWFADSSAAGQLFSLKIRGGNAFNLFADGNLGQLFWTTQAVTILLAIGMPVLRLLGGSLLAVLGTICIAWLHYREPAAATDIPIEFSLLIVFVLYSLYVLMSYIGEVRDRKRFTELLSQYVPPELASQYSRNPQSMGLQGESRIVSVLFCDVVDFSAASEQLQSAALAEWLNEFLAVVGKIVVRHRGTIDKYMGDSVMAVWGAPAPTDTHAFDALQAALDIAREVDDLNEGYARRGLPAIQVGIGVSTGLANVGSLGSEYRMDYTVIGDTVNVARRLEEQTRKYPVDVIVSDATVETLPDILFRELDTVMVKGRKQPVTMYEPVLAEALADDKLAELVQKHEAAMSASKSSQWSEAHALFSELRDEWGPVEMYDLYLRGIEEAASHAEPGRVVNRIEHPGYLSS